jgi:hypothetical protein
MAEGLNVIHNWAVVKIPNIDNFIKGDSHFKIIGQTTVPKPTVYLAKGSLYQGFKLIN